MRLPIAAFCLCVAVRSFSIAADDSEIIISNGRARALLAMLCLAKGEPIDRDFLSKLLWHRRFEAHAKASLLELRKLLAPSGNDILAQL